MIGDKLLNIQRTYRGISVITPLSIRRGAGGEAISYLNSCTAYGAPEVFTLRSS